jgi:hypothetical protein
LIHFYFNGGFMSRTPNYFKWGFLTTLILAIAGLAMACGPTAPVPSPLATQERGQVADVPPPTPTTPATPTDVPSLVAPDDSCVSCHYDKEQLIATADEEEVVEELSEGEG